MSEDLAGKVVLITGASRGIGRATALACAHAGAVVVLHARARTHLEDVSEQVLGIGGKSLVVTFDLSFPEGIATAYESIFRVLGRLDGCVNNAGMMTSGLLGMISAKSIQETLGCNLQGTILSMQYAARLMRRRKQGSIVNLSSIMGTRGAPGLVAYAASKAGVVGATLAAAKELAPEGIRVNAVAPGFIETDMTRALSAEQRAQSLSQIRMGRAGRAEEVAQAALFLLSDRASYISGQVLGVDGLMCV
ncbi:3-oxoacyl-(acyl-carrier-protein) reductase FabG [Candidatus Accumulibacter aalborgensis]|uniref:3-oxoacyl-(Acyl-carrier-protein) reductase FabG n=1 Tax=Candidatus Accumulibacter aalborgensis TaxID=1860102 RepID=A0A1A8XIR7_9PROT|nr:SDR family NAD(P)-dependent oxidoreductase [Candidatus Accumulibacter aalborgensis]SBT04586.1 3-oxoacyl-(acyl-carrier-protein) reductase FabG [Candidatus Accumulibacter aalborgensis]